MRNFILVLLLINMLFVVGCYKSHYVTPGGGVQLNPIDDSGIKERFDTKPASPFPARIAVVRVQQSGYYSHGSRGYGRGSFSVVTTRDIEKDEHFEKISSLEQVAGLAALNQLLVPNYISGVKDLRLAAASLHADMLLLYTLNTSFRIKGEDHGPFSVITLGFLPDKKAFVTATASAVLYDVRSGYLYGLAEASHKTSHTASMWSERQVVENARIDTEKEAFSRLVDEFCKTWPDIVKQYAVKGIGGEKDGIVSQKSIPGKDSSDQTAFWQ